MQYTSCPRQSNETSELDTTEETGFINNKITRYNVNVYFYTLINLKNVSIPL